GGILEFRLGVGNRSLIECRRQVGRLGFGLARPAPRGGCGLVQTWRSKRGLGFGFHGPFLAARHRLLERRRGKGILGLGLARPFCRRSEEHTSELQSPYDLVCRLLLAKKNPETALCCPVAPIAVENIVRNHTHPASPTGM